MDFVSPDSRTLPFLKEQELLSDAEFSQIGEGLLESNRTDLLRNAAMQRSQSCLEGVNSIKSVEEARIQLAKMESYVVGSGYNDQTLLDSHSAHRTLYGSILSTEELPFFEIAIPTADRPMSLRNILRSIARELECYGYPKSKVRVHIFNDSPCRLDKESLCAGAQCEIKIWELQDQIDFITQNYNIDKLNAASPGFLQGIFPGRPVEELAYRGSVIGVNTAKVILARLGIPNDLVWFLDDDEEFAVLHKKDTCFDVVPHAFSIFHAYANTFRNGAVRIATGKCVGDPPFANNQMIRTTLLDQLARSQDVLLGSDYYNENLAYLDQDILPRKRFADHYESGYPLLPFREHGQLSHHPPHSVLFGHHPSRPICYHPKVYEHNESGDIVRSLGATNYLYPGNAIYRREKLGLLCPFANHKLRMNGAIFGHFLAEMNEAVEGVFIPIFHRRINDMSHPDGELRTGTVSHREYADFSSSWMKQIEGYVLLRAFQESKGFSVGVEKAIAHAYKTVLEKHDQNVLGINSVIDRIEREGLTKDPSLHYLVRSTRLSMAGLEKTSREKIAMGMDDILMQLPQVRQNFYTLLDLISP